MTVNFRGRDLAGADFRGAAIKVTQRIIDDDEAMMERIKTACAARQVTIGLQAEARRSVAQS